MGEMERQRKEMAQFQTQKENELAMWQNKCRHLEQELLQLQKNTEAQFKGQQQHAGAQIEELRNRLSQAQMEGEQWKSKFYEIESHHKGPLSFEMKKLEGDRANLQRNLDMARQQLDNQQQDMQKMRAMFEQQMKNQQQYTDQIAREFETLKTKHQFLDKECADYKAKLHQLEQLGSQEKNRLNQMLIQQVEKQQHDNDAIRNNYEQRLKELADQAKLLQKENDDMKMSI